MVRSERDGFPRTEKRLLRRYREGALNLPAPGDDWALAEVSLNQTQLQRLSQTGAVERVGRETVEVEREYSGGNYQRNRWRTVPRYHEWIHEHLRAEDECPAPDCHATGIYNPTDAAGYRCSNDDCTRRLSEAEARALLE